jgi:hypothetical protein
MLLALLLFTKFPQHVLKLLPIACCKPILLGNFLKITFIFLLLINL